MYQRRPNSAMERIRASALLSILALIAVAAPLQGHAAEISSLNVRQVNSELLVSATLQPDQKLVEDLYNGLSKEIVYYIDLFRLWKIWPDEFVLGKKIVKILHSDPIKREYVATATEGNVQITKRFKDLDSMIAWAMNIPEIKLTNVKALEADNYYVKITAESSLKKLPPVVGYVLFFVPSKEFSISRDSRIFRIPEAQGAK